MVALLMPQPLDTPEPARSPRSALWLIGGFVLGFVVIGAIVVGIFMASGARLAGGGFLR